MTKLLGKYQIARAFGFESLDKEEKLKRVILVRVILLTVFFGLVWSLLYFILGLNLGGFVVLGYAILSLLNLTIYYLTKNYPPFRFIQLVLILLLPAGTQLALGGFYAASGVVLACILCPLGALMFYDTRVARILFILYLVVVVLVAGVEYAYPERGTQIDNRIVLLFYAMNTIVITSIIFALLLYFIAQRALFQKMLAEKNKDLTDSIRYAKRIQEAILPPLKSFKETFPDSFVLYKPKDIVAGDFYFFEKRDDLIYFAVADCTGHGVPGAMVSVVCSNALNRVIKEYQETNPGKILNEVRELVIENLARGEVEDDGKLMYVRDGMDISLAVLNLKTLELNWAGANNGIWVVRESVANNFVVDGKDLLALDLNSKKSDGKLKHSFRTTQLAHLGSNSSAKISFLELKADKQPIGKYDLFEAFTPHHVQLQKNDCIYLFSDGYEDQFGGEKGKKFKSSNMRMMVEAICNKPMDQQQIRFDEVFETWRGELEQIDDVCVMGIRLS